MPELTIISLGAGVQSSTMLLMAEHGELPRPDVAIFADTRWEPQAIYNHLDWLKSQTSIPIIIAGTRNLRQDTMDGHTKYGKVRQFVDIPHYIKYHDDNSVKLSHRQCTTNYKIKPIRQAARKFAGYTPRQRIKPGAFDQWIGISTDEIHRMKPSNRLYVVNKFPLIDAGMSRRDCVSWFARHYPGQPLSKSSCLGCPFHNDQYWIDLYKRGGPEWTDTVAVDEQLRAPDYTGRIPNTDYYLHRSAQPLAQIIPIMASNLDRQATLPGLETDAYGNECEGVCFT